VIDRGHLHQTTVIKNIYMNNKKLSLAIAAALVTPLAVHAEVKLSGTIQAEAVSWQAADGNENAEVHRGTTNFGDDHDSQTLTNDAAGAVLNEGPNGLTFDIEEKLGGGMSAFARYAAAFNTSGNQGLSAGTAEAFVGLGTQSFSIRYGTMVGAYKSSVEHIDPWLYTSLQASGSAGGMTGETHNCVSVCGTATTPGKIAVDTAKIVAHGGGMGLTNEGYVEGALDLGVHVGGFEGHLQGVVDDTSAMDGAGLIELKYSVPNTFAVWLAGAFTDLKDAKSTTAGGDGYNWKIGGNYQVGSMMKIGLQYEEAELGAFDGDINPDGGKYIMGSLDLTMSNVTLAGWVAGYLSDIEDTKRLNIGGNTLDEDALSWALGAKYHFSKRTQIYAGYRMTDSDNDYRDEEAITMGIRHTF
jgi:predicted porin